MKRIVIFLLIVLLLPGCCIFKKTRTVETITRIDTVLMVRVDTVNRVVSVPVYDTAFIETFAGSAVSYIDTGLNRIVLTFKGSNFQLPIKMYQSTIRVEQIPRPDKPRKPLTNFQIWFLVTFGGSLLVLQVVSLIKK